LCDESTPKPLLRRAARMAESSPCLTPSVVGRTGGKL
jgi:hypothetical protein